jgi:hypothetical protein
LQWLHAGVHVILQACNPALLSEFFLKNNSDYSATLCLQDLWPGGTDTSSVTIEWAMAELL